MAGRCRVGKEAKFGRSSRLSRNLRSL
jgi:hypothetical protein